MSNEQEHSPGPAAPASEWRTITLASFLLALLATAPALLLLGWAVLPRLHRLEAALERMEGTLARVEGAAQLAYFSRDPSRSTIDEALAHLSFWTEQETKCRAFEVPDAQSRQEMAISALIAAGPAHLGRLESEALREDLGAEAKLYRRALLRILARLAPERAIPLARSLMTGRFEAQTRIYAATELLALAPGEAAEALRGLIEANDHLTLEGFTNLLGLYIHQATDAGKGAVLHRILERPTLDLATVMEVVKAIPVLPPSDPALPTLAEDLEAIYLRPDTVRDRFQSSILLRPHGASLLPSVRREIVRSLGSALPRPALAAFLDRADRVETDPGILGAIARIRQEQGL